MAEQRPDLKDAVQCSWCSGELETVYQPGEYDTRIMGVCPDDGIVYVEPTRES